jgi:ADP-heptose:LPS heptosyltransferase
VHLLTFANPISFKYVKTAGLHHFTAQPRVPYVFSFVQHDALIRTEKVRDLVALESLFWPRLPPFVVRPTGGRGESVLFFAGAGGYGDQVLAWPAAHLLHELGYQVHVLIDPGNDHLWTWLPWVRSVRLFPIAAADLDTYDHLALYPYVTNVDEHPGQPHPTDHLLRQLGVEPSTIPPERKRVRPPLTLGQLAVVGGAPPNLGLIQLAGSNVLRRPTPAHLRRVLADLVTAVPAAWVTVHDVEDEHAAVAREVARDHPNLTVRHNLQFDEFVGLTAAARLTVGPDSFLTHLRGALGLPGVAVFGTHDPALRTRYYPEIRPVWERAACASAPCHVYRRTFPRYLCPPTVDGKPREECAVISAGYDRLVGVVKESWASLPKQDKLS